jgi:hypothetical protein
MGPPLVDRLIGRLKNNPLIALFLVVAFVATSVATFTDALKRLGGLAPDRAPVEVAGRWQSGMLKDRRTALDYHYRFDIKAEGPRVYGSARRVIPSCPAGSTASMCEGQGREVAIVDGTRDAKGVTFACDWGELPGMTPWSWVRVKETFRGTVRDGTLRLVLQDDQNNPPVELEATAVANPAG